MLGERAAVGLGREERVMQRRGTTPMMFVLGVLPWGLHGVLGAGARVCNYATLIRELCQSKVG